MKKRMPALSEEIEKLIDGKDDESVPGLTQETQPLFDEALEQIASGFPYVEPLPAVGVVMGGMSECTPDESGQISLLEWSEWERGHWIDPCSTRGREYRWLRVTWNNETARHLKAAMDEARDG